MLKYIFLIAFISLIFSQEKASLTIYVLDFENQNGDLQIALSNTKASYLTDDVLFGKRIKVDSDTMIVLIENLDFGEYAIQAYHDEDGNQELTTNFIRMPTERYAFSNNARSAIGPADYEDSKFIINKNKFP